jgi:hypothetical protein
VLYGKITLKRSSSEEKEPVMVNELTSTICRAVARDITQLAREKYIFPEKGLETAQFIEAQLEQGCYDEITSPGELADRLTADLRRVSNDQHWLVSYDSSLTSALYKGEEETSAEDMTRLKESIQRSNFGIQKFEHLPGNIGYVDLRGFDWIGFPGAGDSIVALMQLVSHCDALIFDVRRNSGGEVETLQVYVSYFVKPDPKLYDSFYYRPTQETQQFWTMPYVPGSRMADVPLYILTSRVTGSGGEAFAYILKSMGRATVVGESTLGAAHTTGMEIVQEQFQVEFPSGRSISPFTQGDWEGVGVQPDIAVPPEEALHAAHLHALERLIQVCQDDTRKQELDWDLEITHNTYTPFILDEAILARYVGLYGDRTIGLAGGALTYSRQGGAWKLIPLGVNRFLCPDWLKLEFALDEHGQALSVRLIYRVGRPGLTLAKQF